MRHAWMEILYTCRNEVQSFYATYWSSWSEDVNPHGQAHSLSLGPWSLRSVANTPSPATLIRANAQTTLQWGGLTMNQFRFPVRKCGKRGLWTSHMSSSWKKMSGWGWERHGQSHPINHVEKLWQPGLRLVNPNATGRVKLHRDLSKWQCTPSNVLPWSFKITIVLKQFVITEAFYEHLMPWNLPNSNESWKSKRQEFHGIQILGCPFFCWCNPGSLFALPASNPRHQMSNEILVGSFAGCHWIELNLFDAKLDTKPANPGATWDDGTRTVQRSKMFDPSHRHHPDRFQVALS